MDEGALFGELRSLFQHAPSAQLWRELCELADAWSDEGFVHVALDYALNHLRGWPDALREPPPRWVDALAYQQLGDEPRALLCTTLAPRSGSLEHDELMRLCASPYLAHITTLDLGGWGLSAGHIAHIVASPHLSNLTTLELGLNPIGPDGARAIAASPHMGRLSALYMVQCHIGPEGAAMLAASPHMRQLRALNVRQNKLGDVGVAALGALALEELYAGENEVGDVGLSALCGADSLRGMHTLVLDRNAITASGVEFLLAPGSTLRGLEVLDLCSNHINDAGLSAFARAPHLGVLEELRLHNNSFSDTWMQTLAASPYLSLSIRAAWMDAPEAAELVMDPELLRASLESLLSDDLDGDHHDEYFYVVWREVQENLALWPPELLEERAIPLVLERVAEWPVGDRSSEYSWMLALLSGQPSPCLILCDLLRLDPISHQLDAQGYARVFAAPELANIRHIECESMARDLGEALAASPIAGQIEQIRAHYDSGELLDVLARSPSFCSLRGLTLGDSITAEQARAFADAPHLATVRFIEFWGDPPEILGILDALISSPYLGEEARAAFADQRERVLRYRAEQAEYGDEPPF
jgi:hypothetical protein